MDLDTIEGLNEIRLSVYRAAMKLLSLQRLCHMDMVSVRHIMAAVHSLGGTHQQQQTVTLNREEVTWTLNRMFHSVEQVVPGNVTLEAPEKMRNLMLRLFERAGSVSVASLQTALIALSSDDLMTKYRALVSVSKSSSGSVSRSGLRSLLQDLSQLPAAVQEEVVFGGVEAAVRSCFNGVLTPTVNVDQVLSWLQSEPHLLLWLPTLYRLSVSQNVSHRVRCHTCKSFPITGLRYRCLKCVNVHVCQSCFLSERQTRKHKRRHPVLEFCTQPTWKESLHSFVHSARHTLLPRQHAPHRQAETSRWATTEECVEQDRNIRTLPTSDDALLRLVDSAVQQSPSSDTCMSLSKALQTDEDMLTQQAEASALISDIRNLQRDKWLLEQEMKAWQLTVQSEQGILEDRCSEMEGTVEKLRQQNVNLQVMLTQALNKMETHKHVSDTQTCTDRDNTENDTQSDTTEDTQEDGEDKMLMKEEWSEDTSPTPSPTFNWLTPSAGEDHLEEEEPVSDRCLCQPVGAKDVLMERGRQEEDACLSEEEGDYGMSSPEELVQHMIDRLKTVMETETWRERQTGEKKRVELVEAADQVGQTVRELVEAVRTETH